MAKRKPKSTNEEQMSETLFDDLLVEDEVKTEEENINVPPSPTSLEWNDYVIGLFSPEELDNGNPKVDGLRRVAQLLLGKIQDEYPDVKSSNSVYACVEYTFVFDGCRVAAVADSTEFNNVTAPYSVYPVAIAETRAMGRALRKALNLRNVVSAEEISQIAAPQTTHVNVITGAQVITIDKLCKNLNVNVNKLLETGKMKYTDISSVTQDAALEMIQLLNRYQSDTSNTDHLEVPVEIKGYDKDWRTQ